MPYLTSYRLILLLQYDYYIELYASLISSCLVQGPAGGLDAVVRAGWGSRGVATVQRSCGCVHTRALSVITVDEQMLQQN